MDNIKHVHIPLLGHFKPIADLAIHSWEDKNIYGYNKKVIALINERTK